MSAFVKLLGRVMVTGDIKAKTGFRIGGGSTGLNIGGVDNPVIRDPLSRQPYIPGSSLKGKMRSLSERNRGFNPGDDKQIQRIQEIRIHACKEATAYKACNVCQVFGLSSDKEYQAFVTPTRLVVRDVMLDPATLAGAQMDASYVEVKWENAIDRITSQAVPRQVERVPAGAVFKDFEMIYSFYDLGSLGNGTKNEICRLKTLFEAMQLLEDDYLGGMGSRGSGKIRFQSMRISLRRGAQLTPFEGETFTFLSDLLKKQDHIIEWLCGLLIASDPDEAEKSLQN